jgi:hypothetical protein
LLSLCKLILIVYQCKLIDVTTIIIIIITIIITTTTIIVIIIITTTTIIIITITTSSFAIDSLLSPYAARLCVKSFTLYGMVTDYLTKSPCPLDVVLPCLFLCHFIVD